jgi:hypothetical protein
MSLTLVMLENVDDAPPPTLHARFQMVYLGLTRLYCRIIEDARRLDGR